MKRKQLFLSIYYVLFCFVSNDNFYIIHQDKVIKLNDLLSASKDDKSNLYEIIKDYSMSIIFSQDEFEKNLKALTQNMRKQYISLKKEFFNFLNKEKITPNDIPLIGSLYKLRYGFDTNVSDNFLTCITDFLRIKFKDIPLSTKISISKNELIACSLSNSKNKDIAYALEMFEKDFSIFQNEGYINNDFYLTNYFILCYKKAFFYEFDDNVKKKFGINLKIA